MPRRRGPVPLDEIAVERACQGDRVRLRRAEKLEVVRRLTWEWRMSAREIGLRLALTERQVFRLRARIRMQGQSS